MISNLNQAGDGQVYVKAAEGRPALGVINESPSNMHLAEELGWACQCPLHYRHGP